MSEKNDVRRKAIVAALEKLRELLRLKEIRGIDPAKVKTLPHEIQILGDLPCVLHGGKHDGVLCLSDQRSVIRLFATRTVSMMVVDCSEASDRSSDLPRTLTYRRRPELVDGVAHYDLV